MPSHTQSYFQRPPPIRTSTVDSQSSGAMSPSSETLSPTSTSGQARGAMSATEESFFGAIAERMRRSRSRSRSRNGVSRNRSKSPMVMPPEHLPLAPPTQPTRVPQTPQPTRLASTSRLDAVPAAKPSRPSLQGPSRRSTSGSDMWRGRHSNEWLFNGFSVTETAKDIFHIGRKPSS
ncbi:hypothetical protein B0J11DRAFT_110604 [Dendryphion nanum]|uniref:Uncharacterized protein n=1 Tax=Dendryphion nanum TaxID=256645 RepID=A0A9P9DB83_9PLEO|nr:hypothetical protein B0J11DRAFT_110604 [Dendryphion nanum]